MAGPCVTCNIDDMAVRERVNAYRARMRLAEQLATSDSSAAEQHLNKALEQSPSYAPAHAILGKILLEKGRYVEARASFEIVIKAGTAGPTDELAYGAVLLALGQREAARDALGRAKAKGATDAGLTRLAEAIDPDLLEDLDVPKPPSRKVRRRPR